MRAILYMLLLWQTCTPLCVAPLDWSAVFHFLAPLTDLRIPMHAPFNRCAVFYFIHPLTDIHAPLHALSDRSAVSHFVAPLTDMRTPLHAPSDRSAVFHFVALLIDVHAIYMFLLLTYALSHSYETLTLPPALVTAMIQTCHDTNWKKLVVADKVCPKNFAMMILWCAYFLDAKHRHASLCVDVYLAKE
jgi:hypothetical protein